VKTEDKRQKTEDKRQKTEDGRQKNEEQPTSITSRSFSEV